MLVFNCITHCHLSIILNVYLLFSKGSTTPKKSATLKFDPPKLQDKEPITSIEFHVLLSKEAWFWDDAAEVYIRFSDVRLGGFNCCHGPMHLIE